MEGARLLERSLEFLRFRGKVDVILSPVVVVVVVGTVSLP